MDWEGENTLAEDWTDDETSDGSDLPEQDYSLRVAVVELVASEPGDGTDDGARSSSRSTPS